MISVRSTSSHRGSVSDSYRLCHHIIDEVAIVIKPARLGRRQAHLHYTLQALPTHAPRHTSQAWRRVFVNETIAVIVFTISTTGSLCVVALFDSVVDRMYRQLAHRI